MLKHLNFDFEIKKKGKAVVIEGYGSANTVDRMKERISPDAWLLENYAKNPVILFDHGKDPAFGVLPVGKALAYTPDTKGLYMKVQLSNSQTEKISAVRDLVEEGILKTFSVGFDPKETEKDAEDPETQVIKRAELIECSIVPVPMNQDSTFSVLSKKYEFENPVARRWLDRYVAKADLCRKGHWFAAALNQRMAELIDAKQIADEAFVVQRVAQEALCEQSTVRNVLTGKVKSAKATVVAGFAKVLRLDQDFLANLNNGRTELVDEIHLSTVEEDEGMASKKNTQQKSTIVPEPKAGEGEAKPDEEAKPEEKVHEGNLALVIQSIAIPKEAADTAEAAIEMAAAAGYGADKISETDSAWVLEQADSAGLDMEHAYDMQLGNGVMAKVAPKRSEAPAEEGKAKQADDGQDMPEDKPDQQEPEPMADNFSEDELKEAVTAFEAEMAATQEGLPGNPPSWVTDEALWDKAKQASEAALGEIKYPFVVWWYQNHDGGKSVEGKSLETGADAKNIDGTDDNPYHELARQSNVLLGTLINEVQNMSAKLNGIADLSLRLAKLQGDDKEEADGETPPPDGKEAKSVDLLARFGRDCDVIDARLKRLGV